MGHLDVTGELPKFFRRLDKSKKRGFGGGTPADSKVKVRIPDGVEWEIWRIVSSGRIHVSLIEIQTQWSIEDVWQAHQVLDLHEELEYKASQVKPKRRR